MSEAVIQRGDRRSPAARWSESTGWMGLAYECWLLARAWWRDFAGRGRAQRQNFSVTARLDLGSKKSLLLVTSGRRRFLVASGAETISAMIEIRPRSQVLSGRAAGRRNLPRRRGSRSLIDGGGRN